MDIRQRVVIDAGHGGEYDPGAVFEGRQEKDDSLRLALGKGNRFRLWNPFPSFYLIDRAM